MPIWVGAGGVWKAMNDGAAGASGVQKSITTVHAGAGGVWKQAYPASAGVVVLNRNMRSIGVNPNFCSITFNNTGTVSFSQTYNTVPVPTSYTWLLAGVASSYDIMFTDTGLDPPNGGVALSVWHNLATSRTVSWTTNSKDGALFIEIRPAGGGSVIDSGTFSVLMNP